MQALLRRYRDLTVLAVVVLVQLALLGSQTRGEGDAPLIRQWAVSAVVPFARAMNAVRDNTFGSLSEFFVLVNARADNTRLKAENDRLKLENQYLKNELGTADRAKSLAVFQEKSPSKLLAARLIGSSGSGSSSKTVFIDRGAKDGIRKGMAVITPDGVVGKVTAAFPAAAQVMLITDPAFAAGVISGKSRLPGTLRGDSTPATRVDYLPTEAKLEIGEWFYTSGDDRVFPRGLPVGRVTSLGRGRDFREVRLSPASLEHGLEDVLVVLDGVHSLLPDEMPAPAAMDPAQLLPPPPAVITGGAPALPSGSNAQTPAPASGAAPAATGTTATPARTDADRLLEKYRQIGQAQGHRYGAGSAPDFNKPPTPPAVATGTAPSNATPNPAAPSVSARPPSQPPTAPPPPVQPAPRPVKPQL